MFECYTDAADSDFPLQDVLKFIQEFTLGANSGGSTVKAVL